MSHPDKPLAGVDDLIPNPTCSYNPDMPLNRVVLNSDSRTLRWSMEIPHSEFRIPNSQDRSASIG